MNSLKETLSKMEISKIKEKVKHSTCYNQLLIDLNCNEHLSEKNQLYNFLKNNEINVDHIDKEIEKGTHLNYFILENKQKEAISWIEEHGIVESETDLFGSPIVCAITWERIDVLKKLLQIGTNPNKRDSKLKTPIMFAKSVQVVELLLEAGASVEEKDDSGDSTLENLASISGNIGVLEYITKKINIGQQQVEKAIMKSVWASLHENMKFLFTLLKNQNNVRDEAGITPLMVASQKNNVHLLHYLITKGFDVNEKDSYGRDSLFFAINIGAKEATQYLIEKGANVNEVYPPDNQTVLITMAQRNKINLNINQWVDIYKIIIKKTNDLGKRNSNSKSFIDYLDSFIHKKIILELSNHISKMDELDRKKLKKIQLKALFEKNHNKE